MKPQQTSPPEIADGPPFPLGISPARSILWIAVVALVYFAAARLSLMLVVQPEGIAVIWPPEGIFLSAILLTRHNLRLPLAAVLCITDLIAELLAGTPFLVGTIYALSLTGDAVLSSWLLLRFVGEPIAFRKARDVIGFLTLAVVLSNGLMSLAAAAASTNIPGTSFWNSWKWWAASDGIGNLLVTPFLLSWGYWVKTRWGAWNTRRALEGASLFSLLVLLNIAAFRYLPTSGLVSPFLPYLTFPLLLWAALSFGVRGVASALIILAAMVIPLAVAGRLPGLFSYESRPDAVMIVQLYLAVMAIPSLFLAAVVTERKLAEETLREKEARLSKAQEIAHVGSWELDIPSNRLIWSNEAYRIFGVAPGSFVPTYQAFLDAVHPEDRPVVDDAYSSSLQEGRDLYEIEHRIVQKSTGDIRYVHEKCEHIRDTSHRIIRSVGMVHDITERKQAEAALRERNRYIETILENSPIGFAVNTIHDGRSVFVSRRFEEIYGVPHGNLQSVEGFFEKVYLDPEFREQIRARIIADMASGDAARMRWEDLPITTAAGEKKFITAINIPLLDQNLMVSTVQDVTARHRAEEALRESERRFRTLVEQAGDGFELLDADGRYVDVNSATCRQLGYSREELLGRRIEEIDPSVSREQYIATFQSLVSNQPVRFETVHRRKNGTTFPVEVTTSAIRLDDDLMALTLVRDITERKQAEEEQERLQAQLLQAQKMESVGRLAGGVAHDFNNMLGVILGHGELALEKLEPTHPLRSHLEGIQNAAQRSADLTRQLLAFARKQTVAPKVLDLNDTIGGMLKMLRRLIGEDIDLAWMPGANLWLVKIDPTQIDQILANLCVNARDAITGIGKVTIETENQSIDDAYCIGHAEAVPGPYVMLAVSDDGCGLDKEILDHLFEPFFTTKHVGRGTGLGLATVYGIVKQNEGFINVYSEPGKGTTFKIYLPSCATGPVSTAGERAARTAKGGTETILLVEDEETLLHLSQTILEGLGYRVLTANTPGKAIQLAQAHAIEIHLLITDVVLPELTGRELSERIRQIKPDLRCLFTSGYTANVIAHHGVLEEGVHFIQKPFHINELAAKVRETLDEV